MNAVQRDLAGWDSEKLSERSAVLHLNATTDVTFSVRQKGCLWPAFTAANLSSRAGHPARSG
jgi:hypothetical protein